MTITHSNLYEFTYHFCREVYPRPAVNPHDQTKPSVTCIHQIHTGRCIGSENGVKVMNNVIDRYITYRISSLYLR